MMIVPLNNRIDLHLSATHFTKHTHGPKVWPWWKLVVLHVAYWKGETYSDGCNIWIYTRWGAWCQGLSWPRTLIVESSVTNA